MKKIIFIVLVMCCQFSMAQKRMEMMYVSDFTVNDTSVRIYNLKNYRASDPNRWYIIAEYLINVVFTKIEPEDLVNTDSLSREDVTTCDYAIFYCMDDFDYINHPITKELLYDESFRKKIVCKFDQTTGDFIVDPFHYGIYKE